MVQCRVSTWQVGGRNKKGETWMARVIHENENMENPDEDSSRARGQLFKYVALQMGHQPRLFVFAVGISGPFARFYRFDHSSVCVSASFDYHEDPIPSFWEGEAAVAGLGGRRREAQRRSAGGLGSAPAISNPAVAARIYHDDVLDNPHPICFLGHLTTANESSAVAQPWLSSASG